MIKKTNLKWQRPLSKLDLLKVDSIAVHHAAHPTWGVAEIHDFHGRPVADGGRGWKGHAYAYEVDKDGTIWETRGYEHEGGGVTGCLNKSVLSIVFQGDFDKETMGEKQFNAGVYLLAYLKTQLNIKHIAGHKTWETTTCPGRNFPLGSMTNAANNAVYIMGEPELKVEQMRKFLRGINPNAPDVEQLFLGEGNIEGVRGDIAFCQAIHETDYFRFTGTAMIEWNNPAGLGVTGPAGVGNRFPSWQEGIRAQIQHLKAYAKKYPVYTSELIDPRYGALVAAGYLGMAPRWTDLNGKWAYPGTTYGQAILSLYQKVSAIEIDSDSEKAKLLTAEIESLKSENKRLHNMLNEIQDILHKR